MEAIQRTLPETSEPQPDIGLQEAADQVDGKSAGAGETATDKSKGKRERRKKAETVEA